MQGPYVPQPNLYFFHCSRVGKVQVGLADTLPLHDFHKLSPLASSSLLMTSSYCLPSRSHEGTWPAVGLTVSVLEGVWWNPALCCCKCESGRC